MDLFMILQGLSVFVLQEHFWIESIKNVLDVMLQKHGIQILLNANNAL